MNTMNEIKFIFASGNESHSQQLEVNNLMSFESLGPNMTEDFHVYNDNDSLNFAQEDDSEECSSTKADQLNNDDNEKSDTKCYSSASEGANFNFGSKIEDELFKIHTMASASCTDMNKMIDDLVFGETELNNEIPLIESKITSSKRKMRKTPQQTKILNTAYAENEIWDKESIATLAKSAFLTPTQVYKWYSTKRRSEGKGIPKQQKN